jgi:hypothetical protein
MGSSYYPEAYGGGRLDFSGIESLGDSISGAISKTLNDNAIKSALSEATGPDGAVDYNKAFGNLLAAGRTKEAQVIANYAESQEMAKYRNESLKPDAVRTYEAMYGPLGQAAPAQAPAPFPEATPVPTVPMRLGPDGKPTLQEFIQSQTASKDPRARAKATQLGKQDASNEAKMAQEPHIQSGINRLRDIGIQYQNDPSFEYAIGPLQGAQPDDIVTRELARGARGMGEVGRAVEGWWTGKEGTAPTEIRAQIASATQALTTALKPFIRSTPGEGPLSEWEQQQMASLVGNLAESRDIGEYNSRLQGVVENLNANYGMDLKLEDLATLGKTQERLTPGAEYDAATEPPAPRAPPSVTESSVGGTIVREGPGAAPPLPGSGDKARLIAAYKRYSRSNPSEMARTIEKFNSVYQWPGLAEEIIGELEAGR